MLLLFCCLSYSLGQFVNNEITEVCDSYVQETPATQVFLYTDSYKVCPDPEFAEGYQLNCSTNTGISNYLRLALRTPAASASASYNQTQILIKQIGSQDDTCLPIGQSCATRPCNTLTLPVVVGIITTRTYVKYTLSAIPQGQIPYSYFPVDSNTAYSSSTCSALSSCTCTEDNPNAFAPCTITDPLSIATNCGPNSDPNTGYSTTLNTLCTTVCCQTCNAVTASQHRRWAVGPTCQLYQISGPQLVVDAYVAANTASETQAIEAFVEGLNAAVSDTFVGHSENPAFAIEGNIIRMYVNKVYADAQSNIPVLKGLVILCDYGNVTNQMGSYNPYVTLNAPVQVTFDSHTFTINNGRFRTPGYNTDPSLLGAGLVPTIEAMNRGVSMFYLNESMATAYTSSSFLSYIQGQANILENYKSQNGPYPNYQNTTWWNANNGVPGWQLGGTPPVSNVPSPCQMANSVNTYAINYNNSVISNGGDYEAAVGEAGSPSPYLLPNYRIDKPNWWPDAGNALYFDLATVFTSQQVTMELFIDIIGTVLQETTTVPLLQFTSQTTCVANISSGVGTALGFIFNTETSVAAPVDIYLSCNYTLLDPTTANPVPYAASVNVSESNLEVVPGQTAVTSPFPFTFSNKSSSAPTCQFTAVSTLLSQNYTSQIFTCYIPLNPGDITSKLVTIIGGGNVTDLNPPSSDVCGSCQLKCLKDKGELLSSWCFWGFMIFLIVLIFAFTAGTIFFICTCCHKRSSQKEHIN